MHVHIMCQLALSPGSPLLLCMIEHMTFEAPDGRAWLILSYEWRQGSRENFMWLSRNFEKIILPRARLVDVSVNGGLALQLRLWPH